jgi:SAM-dependent methyltransferase
MVRDDSRVTAEPHTRASAPDWNHSPVPACCRLCGAGLEDTFVDLGESPLCETYIGPDQLNDREPRYPLHVWVCRACLLVQIEAVVPARLIFDEYAYFSSYSESWVEHARQYCDAIVARLSLGPASRVVEVASNDGYLLQHFRRRGLQVLGVEPAANVAAAAIAKGIPTDVRYFGSEAALEIRDRQGPADLIVANNVLAHVPDLNDFIEGLARLLSPAGVITLEIPHLLRLIEQSQFDTIYHEHFSYFSLLTAERALRAHGLEVFDVDELATHGGSLRLYARVANDTRGEASQRVIDLRATERGARLDQLEGHAGFAGKVERVARDLRAFLETARHEGRHVAGYGAPGKGNTLLNYCGIGPELLEYTVDRNPYKQGKFTPGMRIPIHAPDRLAETKPDYVLILPWNLKDEITRQMADIRVWGGRFVVPIPALQVLA